MIPPYEPEHYSNVDTTDWDFSEPGMNKNNVDNHYLEQVLPDDLGEPKPQVIEGEMRSDRIELPEGVTKQEADAAEVQEARQLGITTDASQRMQPLAADNCRSYWPSANQVCGAIRAKYESMAVSWAGQTPVSFLGLPISDELTNPDGVGKRTQFQNGFIYWHPDTGAWSVTTHNSLVWQRSGWEVGRLGYPISDEIGTGDGVGRKQFFQRGRIYGSFSGVVSIEGKILEKWIETGEEKRPLGYPATDEEGTPDGIGRNNRFALGMIYWHPQFGAHTITGALGAIWAKNGFERSLYGYPIGDPYIDPEMGLTQEFSSKRLTLTDLFGTGEIVSIKGKDYSKDLYDFNLQVLGIDFNDLPSPNEYSSIDGPQAPSMNMLMEGPESSRYIPLYEIVPQQNTVWKRGFNEYQVSSKVVWPSNYIYDPGHSHKKVHDFCTWSTDMWRQEVAAPNVYIDFRGPCARHDQCFEKYTDQGYRLSNCNPQFLVDLKEVCMRAPVPDATRQDFISHSEVLFDGVKVGEGKWPWQ